MAAAEKAWADEPVDVAWYTTRERQEEEVLAWDHLDSGLDRDWLWEDWQDALNETEVDDCRWTPASTAVSATRWEPKFRSAHRAHVAAIDGGHHVSRVSRDPGREYIAPVMKVRLRYAKRGRLRFSSHRDFQRAFERALRRAGVPMAYSAGFRPHPKISYANAAPTGVASEAEYIEIGLAARFDVDQLRADLDEAMPTGLDIVDAVEVREGDLVSRLEASVAVRSARGDAAGGEAAVERLLAADEITVERMMKSGLRRFDARNAIRTAEVSIAPQNRVGVRYSLWS